MKRIIALVAAFSLAMSTAYAQIGNNGFDLGISSGRLTTEEGKKTTKSYPYSELVLVTGEPLVFSGTVSISKSVKKDVETLSYKYALTNGEKNKLTRTSSYSTNLSFTDNQCVRTTSDTGTKLKETIKIDGITYTLDTTGSVFSLSSVSDLRPACDYYAGNWNSKKTYKTGKGKQVTINMTSQHLGYEQYWGATEIQDIKVYIVGTSQSNDIYDQWGGSGSIKITQTTTNKLTYIDNKPDAISFEGGYLRKMENNSTMAYSFKLPLFDSKGIASDVVTDYSDTLNFSVMPEQERLNVADTSAIRGHWYEENVRQLAGLGILNGQYLINYKKLDENMSRKEFAAAIAKAVKLELLEIPVAKKKKEYVERPFVDIDEGDDSYQFIYSLYKKGVMTGTGQNMFSPNNPISRAQAILIVVRMLGLETIAGTNLSITRFRDNDDIPIWAKSSVLSAEKIGLINGDENNNLNPNAPLSVAAACTLINNLINYMSDDMLTDYVQNTIIIN